MKKLMVVTAVLLLAAAFCLPSAQAKVKFGAGGEFGLNIATWTSDIQNFDQGKKSRVGLLFGGVVSIAFNDWIGLQPGVRYSMKGAGFDYQAQGVGNVSEKDKMDYMEIPLYFRFSIPTGSIFTPNFLFGPVLGIKLGAKYKATWNGGAQSGTIPNTKSLDFGLGFGGGGRLQVGSGDIFLNILYDLSLNAAISVPGQNAGDVKNRCLSFAAGYIFNFKTHSAAPATHRRSRG
jgi:hypothetical protein